jgi:hypothetical protein
MASGDAILEWRDGSAAEGTFDTIPISFFDVRDEITKSHAWIGNGRRNLVHCKVRGNGDCIEIDYRGFGKRNHGVELGTLRLSKSLAESDTEIEWRGERERDFSKARVQITFSVDDGSQPTSVEGTRRLMTHIRLERNPGLRREKIASAVSLACEVCGFDFSTKYREIGDGFCEVHHLIPLAKGEQDVRLDDLAIVCANCHRMAHRGKPVLTLEKLRELRRPLKS